MSIRADVIEESGVVRWSGHLLGAPRVSDFLEISGGVFVVCGVTWILTNSPCSLEIRVCREIEETQR